MPTKKPKQSKAKSPSKQKRSDVDVDEQALTDGDLDNVHGGTLTTTSSTLLSDSTDLSSPNLSPNLSPNASFKR